MPRPPSGAGRAHRPRQPDERPREQPLHRGLAGLRGQQPRLRAVLVISAHWVINATAVTAMARPRSIHDFYGFPDELFAFEYPAPGLTELADEVAEVAKPHWVGADHDSWGLDHGTWSVLAHMFPDADVPVVQLAINAEKPFDYHFDLGTKLAPLRERGVLILGSGNVVHNLRRIDPRHPDAAFDWASRFDAEARQRITQDPEAVVGLADEPDFPLAAPTPDHVIPLLYLAGLAAAAGHGATTMVDGYAMGSLSMASYELDGPPPIPVADTTETPAATLPDDIPPDQTNA